MGEIAPQEQVLLLSKFCYLMLNFCVKTRIRFSLRDKRLFEITEVEITRVDCTYDYFNTCCSSCLKTPSNIHCVEIWLGFVWLVVLGLTAL